MCSQTKISEISDFMCTGGCFTLVYKDSEVIHAAQHVGQITGKDIVIEEFDNEDEMNLRIVELGLTIPEDI